MAYQVLARKYRPQRFSDVAGQDHVTRTLLNALSQGRTAHGYIFSGHRGIGKTTIARILAMALNCRTAIGSAERPTPEPCGICDSCTEIRAGNAVDVIEIDAATNRGIDEIRELRDAARYRPARDRFKIYILDEAHQITDAAFNALLKTLEEPPDHVVFMMATTQAEDIPQTIRSRCQHFSFHAVRFDDILAELREIAARENVATEDGALALLAEAGDGSMRDALSIMDQAIASAPVEDARPRLDAEQIRELMGAVPNAVFERLMEAISEGQTATVIEELNRLINAGNSPSQLARQFVRYLRNVLMAKIAGENSELLQISPDERARAARSAVLFSEEDLTRFLQVMLRTFDELNYRQEQRFHLELGVIKLVHLERLLPVEAFLSQLPAGGAAPKGGAGSVGGSSGGGMRAAAPSARPSNPSAGTSNPSAAPRQAEPSRTPEPARPAEPPKPAFSPFEADRSRKITSENITTIAADAKPPEMIAETIVETIAAVADVVPVVAPVTAAPEIARPAVIAPPVIAEVVQAEPAAAAVAAPRALTPLETAARAVEATAINTATVNAAAMKAPVAGVAEPAPEATAGALALATEPETLSGSTTDLSRVRDAVCAALETEGHNTAAVLLGAGRWSERNDAIEVEVGIKKTMLSLTMNVEAEKICRNALRSVGVTRKIVFLPGEGMGTGASAGSGTGVGPRLAANGSIQAIALDNPLVRQAQELFNAEVRSVLDLREKK
jgi:DNA polymerase III subunit gamma/tau